MLTLAIANQKGGTAKTTTAATLGAMLAAAGRRVLLIDLDPQASLTQSLGITAAGRSLANAIGGAQAGKMTLAQVIQPLRDNLAILPSDIELADCELGLTQRWGREAVLKTALAKLTGYDLAIIDCPPSLGLLTLNGLVAAGGVIVPTLPAASDLRGVVLFLKTVDRIKENLNPDLELLGVLVTQFQAHVLTHNEALTALQAAGLRILAIIPRGVKVAEAAKALKPITEHDPKGKPTQAYIQLLDEVQKWLNQKPPA